MKRCEFTDQRWISDEITKSHVIEQSLRKGAEIDDVPLIVACLQCRLRQPIVVVFAVIIVLDDHYAALLGHSQNAGSSFGVQTYALWKMMLRHDVEDILFSE